MLRPEPHFAPYRHKAWRVIEGQARSATLRLVDTFEEHDLLEAMLEAAKPPVAEPCRALDYRFWSPFRYGSYPRASRFRRAGRTPGVWYGSEQVLAAVSEAVWGALRFYAASPATPMPRRPVAHSAVQAEVAVARALDLTAPELAGAGRWDDPDDYSDCLALADAARAAGGEAIVYASVRHPEPSRNIALMRCEGFARPAPIAEQNWHVTLGRELVRVSCETTNQRFTFRPEATRLAFA